MWNLEVEWPERVLRGVLVYLALLCMLRISGKRTVGQFTPFDLLVCGVLMALNATAGFLSACSRMVEAVLVARDGHVFRDALRRHRVSRSDWDKALREADCDESAIRLAFLEADGSIVIQKAPRAQAE
ncbi:DUF421 domain-containing protein [Paracidovorax cattleyae]|uniref:DUF421 domain-containing protein n=1 Tax=Paracidovorax cattleyae TaxID=80868 RepID=A0A1H0LHI0_9BURK|nr:hypothetical protein [Paracidovorax cattleyae]AVS75239.1 hypothetical protein C8240_15740 [Paracidovorax cattleyae]MBF9265646.1 hypothetical protein [Paracidovorax cattleyae]SDO67515.1 hypothetical protein SAMN04489708_102191 [Paracidovorax cattleyae]